MAKSKANNEADSQTPAAVADAGDQYEAWREVKSGLHLIPLELVCESPDNARKVFNGDDLASLAASIAATGGINTEAAIVRPLDPSLLESKPEDVADGTLIGPVPIFEIVGGHRRFRALEINGAKFIKAEIIVPESGQALALKAMVCNLHRADLNPIEKSDALAKMLPDYKTVGHMAKALGMNDSTVQGLINLQRLIPAVKSALVGESISMSHALLISREAEEHQAKTLEACFRPEAIDNGAGVEMVPKLVSERVLRDWIKDHLRPQEISQPKLFGTEEEQKEEAKNAETEKQADALLDSSGVRDVGSAANTDSEPAGSAGEAAAGYLPARSDDDLTPEQAAVVRPDQDPQAFEKEQDHRIVVLRSVYMALMKKYWSYDDDLLKGLCLNTLLVALPKMNQRQFSLWKKITSASNDSFRSDMNVLGIVESYRNGTISSKHGGIIPAALLISMVDEISPAVLDTGWIGALTSLVSAAEPSVGVVKDAKGSVKAGKKIVAPKDRPAPAVSAVAKVMKAEKAKLEKKASASKPKPKAKPKAKAKR